MSSPPTGKGSPDNVIPFPGAYRAPPPSPSAPEPEPAARVDALLNELRGSTAHLVAAVVRTDGTLQLLNTAPDAGTALALLEFMCDSLREPVKLRMLEELAIRVDG
jgi:hypothetical protein